MSIIICHNWYRKATPSGENVVVARELNLLKNANVNVYEYMRYNDDLANASFFAKMLTALRMSGSKQLRKIIASDLSKFKNIKILHAHNVMPIISYEVFRAAKTIGLTTIQTLHNYRLLASYKHFYSNSGVRLPNSTAEQLQLQRMVPENRDKYEIFYDRAYKNVWHNNYCDYIDKFICLTQFQKDLCVRYGLPTTKLFVKPNFVSDNGFVSEKTGNYAIFVGRLSHEKGIQSLTTLWRKLAIPLYVVGSGPLQNLLPIAKNIHYFPQMPNEQVIKLIANAKFLVMNSCCYEGFPLTLIEALSCGVPCLVPNIGALPEIIPHGKLGYNFAVNDFDDLAIHAMQLWNNAKQMQKACREEYLAKYTPEQNLQALMAIYKL
jgi:glycosyltransferase involved in cell wall biosynthesis